MNLSKHDKQRLDSLQRRIDNFRYESGKSPIGELSDGSHTFNELYYHRAVLFATLCRMNKKKAWRSFLHHDGTSIDGFFIVGIRTPQGLFSYHYPKSQWKLFKGVKILPKAPVHDGHTSKDVKHRLFSLLDNNPNQTPKTKKKSKKG